jgi:hypothetical protein
VRKKSLCIKINKREVDRTCELGESRKFKVTEGG